MIRGPRSMVLGPWVVWIGLSNPPITLCRKKLLMIGKVCFGTLFQLWLMVEQEQVQGVRLDLKTQTRQLCERRCRCCWRGKCISPSRPLLTLRRAARAMRHEYQRPVLYSIERTDGHA
jgi:hypothetical protein